MAWNPSFPPLSRNGENDDHQGNLLNVIRSEKKFLHRLKLSKLLLENALSFIH